MPCYRPLSGYYSKDLNPTGKRSLVFSSDKALLPVLVTVPCGRCIGCRLDRSLSWAVRCVHEASLHEKNSFITLTFDENHIKGHESLCVSDFQKFMKRFRKFVSPTKIRFFHCGEYGSKLGRPHHHACIFGYDFPDKVFLKSSAGSKLYTSQILSDLWGYGFCTVGDLTFDSAAYVARYVLKKWSAAEISSDSLHRAMISESFARRRLINRSDIVKYIRDEYYDGKHPEYLTMSRNPGVGHDWISKFGSDVYPSGFVVLPSGVKVKPPKYYDSQYELDFPFDHAILKSKRTAAGVNSPDNTKFRLEAREIVKTSKSNNLIRGFENGT